MNYFVIGMFFATVWVIVHSIRIGYAVITEFSPTERTRWSDPEKEFILEESTRMIVTAIGLITVWPIVFSFWLGKIIASIREVKK